MVRGKGLRKNKPKEPISTSIINTPTIQNNVPSGYQ